MIEIYTDGACSDNGSKQNFGGYSVVITKDSKVKMKIKKGARNTTNNIMELMGVLTAIEVAKLVNSQGAPQEIIIYSDSAYVVNTINTWMSGWANNGWIKKSDKKPPENLEIIKKIYSLMNFERSIKVKKVKGHDDNEFNNLADELAVAAREEEQTKYLNEIGGNNK